MLSMGSPKRSFFEDVYAVVRRIPRGQVSTYGRVAEMAGRPRAARGAGYGLNALNDKRGDLAYADIPWQRVVNSQGRISIVNREHSANHQAELLRGEGVIVSDDLRIDLERFLWPGLHLLELDDLLGDRRSPDY
jgi:methylated-DNA-protein-cysteine methyltransferase-like protein